jgi:flagellar biosynthetic protein FliQ
MTPSYVLNFFQEAIILAALLSLPPLLLGLVVGLTISVFQAVTQINEQTLSVVPKMVTIIGALLVFGNWMMGQMMAYTVKVFNSIPNLPG